MSPKTQGKAQPKPDEDPEDDTILEDEVDTTDDQATDDDNLDDNSATNQGDNKQTDWKKSYDGLMRSSQKKRKELEETIGGLQKQLDDIAEELEAKKSDEGTLKSTNDNLQKQLDTVQQQLTSVTSEKEKLDLTLQRQEVVMKDFAEIAPMAAYIPTGENLDEFRENAKQFAEDLGKLVDTGIKQVISGASPSPSGDDTVSSAEVDKLYAEIVQLAGRPGKEDEYAQKYDRYLELLAKQQPTS